MYRTNIAQVPAEIERLAEIAKETGARSLLEVGSKFGGSLWQIATAMPAGSRIVSVDLPNGTTMWRQSSSSLSACILALQARGYDAHLIWGDSTDGSIIEKVHVLGPFDLTFIDANHTRPYAEKDWAAYGPLSRVVAFHDIAWRRAPEWVGVRIDVPEFWAEIKDEYRHEEIRLCPSGKNNGIGVLWRS
jgi:predicted O-methyltransferase YrrM